MDQNLTGGSTRVFELCICINMTNVKKLLREYVHCVMSENEKPTVPAHLSPEEKELAAKHPTWGGKEKIKQDSPSEVKTRQVRNVLQKLGRLQNPEDQKKATQDLPLWIKKREEADHQAFFETSPEDLAKDFEKEVMKK